MYLVSLNFRLHSGGHIWKEHPSNYKCPSHNCSLMFIVSYAHIVYYSCIFGEFTDIDSAVVYQADMLLLTQNIGNWDIEN